MLVLTRRRGQSIVVGENIEITILSVSGVNVRVGISAPPALQVDRREVYERKLRKSKERDD